ncbi:collagen alpha-1(I) chain-like [Erythrolamprus reginae]|uniref:collagen alpha-1(I) chain-like n=1 Tax=Erythrolamprus reginae TaxID=121349 RepID=UPI00396C6052
MALAFLRTFQLLLPLIACGWTSVANPPSWTTGNEIVHLQTVTYKKMLYLNIYRDEPVSGTWEKTVNSAVLIRANSQGHLRIIGVKARLFLCMDKKGELYAWCSQAIKGLCYESSSRFLGLAQGGQTEGPVAVSGARENSACKGSMWASQAPFITGRGWQEAVAAKNAAEEPPLLAEHSGRHRQPQHVSDYFTINNNNTRARGSAVHLNIQQKDNFPDFLTIHPVPESEPELEPEDPSGSQHIFLTGKRKCPHSQSMKPRTLPPNQEAPDIGKEVEKKSVIDVMALSPDIRQWVSLPFTRPPFDHPAVLLHKARAKGAQPCWAPTVASPISSNSEDVVHLTTVRNFTNVYLQINSNGRVDSSPSQTGYTALKITPVRPGYVEIVGVKTNRYLCMRRLGILVGSGLCGKDGETGAAGPPGPAAAVGGRGKRDAPGPSGLQRLPNPAGPPGKGGDPGDQSLNLRFASSGPNLNAIFQVRLHERPYIGGGPGPRGPPGQGGEPDNQVAVGQRGKQDAPGPSGLQVSTGPPGPAGPPGDGGEPGDQGAVGKRSKRDAPGPSGLQRLPGPAGPPSDDRERSFNLRFASSGRNQNSIFQVQINQGPYRGLPSPGGPPGDGGERGNQGELGPPVQSGAAGTRSAPGPPGPAGPPGDGGDPGDQGAVGKRSKRDAPGPSGLQRLPGPAGPPSDDRERNFNLRFASSGRNQNAIFQVQINQGPYRGLPSPGGPPGDGGERGNQGLPSPGGPPGDGGERGNQGLPSPGGPPGDGGERGNQGLPSPGGPPGDGGERGNQGLPSPGGPPGDGGERGNQGESGPPGQSGAAGTRSAPGERGKTGPTGATRSAGPPVPTGVTGPKGAPGVQGPPVQ